MCSHKTLTLPGPVTEAQFKFYCKELQACAGPAPIPQQLQDFANFSPALLSFYHREYELASDQGNVSEIVGLANEVWLMQVGYVRYPPLSCLPPGPPPLSLAA